MPRVGIGSPVRGHRRAVRIPVVVAAVQPAYTDGPHSGAISGSDTFDPNSYPCVSCSNDWPIDSPRIFDTQRPPKHGCPNQHPFREPIKWRSNRPAVDRPDNVIANGCSVHLAVGRPDNVIANGRSIHLTCVVVPKRQPDETANCLTDSPSI